MDGVQLSQDYKATTRRQFAFYHWVPRNSSYSFYRLRNDERLSRPWSHPVVLNSGHLDWESSALNTRPLLHFPWNCLMTLFHPIIARTERYTYNAAQIMAEYPKPLCSGTSCIIRNTQEFLIYLKHQDPLLSDKEYVSYDVEFLFTNVTIHETIDYVLHRKIA